MLSRKDFRRTVGGPDDAVDVVFDVLAGSGANLVTQDRLDDVLLRLMRDNGSVDVDVLRAEYLRARAAYFGAFVGFTVLQGSFYYCLPVGYALQEYLGVDFRTATVNACAQLCRDTGQPLADALGGPVAGAALAVSLAVGAAVTQRLIDSSAEGR